MKIKELSNKYKQYVIDMRREFHMYPELSWQEIRTSKRIKEELESMGISYESVGGTGIVATVKGGKEGKTVALRADIDALEVQQLNEVPYRSNHEGIMHACGHDGHAAMLLGAAKILNEIKGEIKGVVKFFFQPAEEVAQGAKKMIEEGVMEGVNGIFGLHLWVDIPCGTVSIQEGPRMASADIFKIIVKGKGGHGSMPHQGIDTVLAASAIVMDLQSIVSREVSPLESVVVSVGSLHSGTRFNVIASEAVMEGTTRCFNPEIRKSLSPMMERIVKNTASSYRATATLDYTYMTPAVINDPISSAIGEKSVEKLLGQEGVVRFKEIMGAEDYSFFLEKAPGALAFIGAGNKKGEYNYPHHHGRFDIDEDALQIGTALYAQYAVDFLDQG